jgi:hypothetical protein
MHAFDSHRCLSALQGSLLRAPSLRSLPCSRSGRATASGLTLLLVLLGSGLLFWWLGGESQGRSRSVNAEQAPSWAPRHTGALAEASAATGPSAADTEPNPTRRQGLTPLADGQDISAQSGLPGDLLAVEVLLAPSRRPVDGAQVRLCVRHAPPTRPGRVPLRLGIHQGTQALAKGTTDSEGMIRFPWPIQAQSEKPAGATGETYTIEASVEGYWGFSRVGEVDAGEPLSLLLWPDRTVDVVVVGKSDGKPLADKGIQIAYYYSSDDLARRCDSAVSDAAGRVRFSHVTQHMDWFWPHTEFFAVELLDYLGPTLQVRLDPDALQQELTLAVPELVGLTVDVLGVDGQTYTDPGTVSLRQRDPEAEDPEEDFEEAPQGLAVLLDKGRASFGSLAPESPVWIAMDSSQLGRTTPQAHTLPRAGAVSDRFVLQLEERPCELIVRLEDPAGEPLLSGKATLNGRSLEPPASGEVTWRLGAGDLRGAEGPALNAVVSWNEGQSHLTASLAIHSSNATQIDLGTLRLSAASILAAGRVIRSDSSPLANASLRLSAVMGEKKQYLQSTQTDSAGCFTFVGTSEAQLLKLEVFHGDCPARQLIEFAPGQQGIEIIIPAVGYLAGSVLLEPLWLRDFIQMSVRAGSAVHGFIGASTSELSLDECGGFKQALLPGSYSLEVSMSADSEPFQRIDGIRIVAGETNRDARLQGLNLQALARLLTLRPIDPNGESIPEAWACIRAQSGHSWGDTEQAYDGEVHLFTLNPVPEVLVGAPGYRTRLVMGPRSGEKIELLPGERIGLFWKDGYPELPEGARLRFRHVAHAEGWPENDQYLSIFTSREEIEWDSWPGGDRLQTTVSLELRPQGAPRRSHNIGEIETNLNFDSGPLAVPFELSAQMLAEIQRLLTE